MTETETQILKEPKEAIVFFKPVENDKSPEVAQLVRNLQKYKKQMQQLRECKQ